MKTFREVVDEAIRNTDEPKTLGDLVGSLGGIIDAITAELDRRYDLPKPPDDSPAVNKDAE